MFQDDHSKITTGKQFNKGRNMAVIPMTTSVVIVY